MSLLDTASLIVTPNGYKEGKLYSVIPSDGSGDLSVTRATTATRVNSQGLVELVPYNLAQYSEQFDNAYWTKLNASITANATTAPNGSLTADKLVENTALNSHRFLSTAIETIASNQYTISIYLKAAERNYAYVRLNNSGGDIATANIDLVNGVVSQSVIGTFVVTSVGNGWFRVNGTGTSASSSNAYIEVRTSNSATYANYTGDGVSGIYTWGAQLNEGALKDYQKTETRLNIPRLDYSNGTCPSILVEPQRTNISILSNQFNSWNSKVNVTTTSAYTIGPDGNLSATRLQFTSSGFMYNFPSFQQTSGTTYTLSCWVKRNGTGTQSVGFFVNGTGGINSAWNITSEWQRVTYTYTAANSNSVGISGASGADVSVYGWQFEAGSYATSYIPTTSASVTRNADVISKTGISSLIGQTEGTVFLDFYYNGSSIYFIPIEIYGMGRASFYVNASKVLFYEVSGTSVAIPTLSPLVEGRYKMAFVYKLNDFALYSNGVLQGTFNSGAVPTMNALNISDLSVALGAYKQQIEVNTLALWKTRLTNTQLAQLTTI